VKKVGSPNKPLNLLFLNSLRRGIIKKFLYYLGWAIFIGLITYFGSKYRWHLLEKDAAIIFFALFSIVYPIVIGILIKLPNFIVEMKQDKTLKWRFDWIKFIAIALPYLFIMIASSFPNKIVPSSPDLQFIAGVVQGYMLLDSLKKYRSSSGREK